MLGERGLVNRIQQPHACGWLVFMLFSVTLFSGCSRLMTEHGEGIRAGLWDASRFLSTMCQLYSRRRLLHTNLPSFLLSFHRCQTYTMVLCLFLRAPVSLTSPCPFNPLWVFSAINPLEYLILPWSLLLRGPTLNNSGSKLSNGFLPHSQWNLKSLQQWKRSIHLLMARSLFSVPVTLPIFHLVLIMLLLLPFLKHTRLSLALIIFIIYSLLLEIYCPGYLYIEVNLLDSFG